MARKVVSIILFVLGAVYLLISVISVFGGASAGEFLFGVFFAGISIGLGIAVRKLKAETLMILASIPLIIGGIISYFHGSNLNRDFMAIMRYGPNPGNEFITLGVILIIVGIVILVLRYWKKHKSS